MNITVGIPTINRDVKLARALDSVLKQTASNFCVVVSNNGPQRDDLEILIENYKAQGLKIDLLNQGENVGLVRNNISILDHVQTEYFCWLADDDEMSTTYLEDLSNFLDKNPDYVGCTGNWLHSYTPGNHKVKQQVNLSSSSLLIRLILYYLIPDDAFFFGMHRTYNLRKCEFRGYWKILGPILDNWCYAYLFELVLQGRIGHVQTCSYVNNEYGDKHYDKEKRSSRLAKLLFTIIRRLNLYYLYLSSLIKMNKFMYLPLVLFLTVLGLLKDLYLIFFRELRKIFKFFKSK